MTQNTEAHALVKEELEKILGQNWVSDFPEEIQNYSSDMTESLPSEPEFVVMPNTVEEVQAIVEMANEYKIPLVPFVAGANVGGLTIPLKGGIIVDLKRMDRVIRVDMDDMYMILEPGVTFGHIRKLLDEKFPQFVYCYPMAPPFTSVAANALQDGLNNLSLPHGCQNRLLHMLG